METTTLSPRAELIFIINGEDTLVKIHPLSNLAQAREMAIRQTHNTGQPSSKWEIRNLKGHLLSPDVSLESVGLKNGDRLFLTLELAAGGNPTSASTSRFTRVVSLHQEPFTVYIGRAGKGQSGYWGNPIRRGHPCPICKQIHKLALHTLPCYRVYLENRIHSDPVFRERLLSLQGEVLGCFCSPRPCHGDILVEWIGKLEKENESTDVASDRVVSSFFDPSEDTPAPIRQIGTRTRDARAKSRAEAKKKSVGSETEEEREKTAYAPKER